MSAAREASGSGIKEVRSAATLIRRNIFVFAIVSGGTEGHFFHWRDAFPGRFRSRLAQHRLSTAGALQSRPRCFFAIGFRDRPGEQRSGLEGLLKAGQYPKSDSLKNHVDPRTYNYVRRFFALQNVPQQKFNTYRPWLIAMMLEAPPGENSELGVEQFLKQRAQTNHKPITGLESVQEHMALFIGLSERDGEALFIDSFHKHGPNQS